MRRLSPPRCPALKHLGRFFSLEPRTQICAHVTEGEAQTLGGEVAAAPYDQGAPLKRQKKLLQTPERGQVSGHVSHVTTGSPLQQSAFLRAGTSDQMHQI